PHQAENQSVFFQSGSAIRDLHVTGVQTCALPIYGEESWGEAVTANTLNTWDHGDIRSTNLVAHTLRAEGRDAGEDGTGRRVPMESGRAACRESVGRCGSGARSVSSRVRVEAWRGE